MSYSVPPSRPRIVADQMPPVNAGLNVQRLHPIDEQI
jgi:hypothetical protein